MYQHLQYRNHFIFQISDKFSSLDLHSCNENYKLKMI